MACTSTSDLARETVANASRESTTIGEHARAVIYPLTHLLLEGQPVPVEKLANHSEMPPDQVDSLLQQWGAERNDAGEITGMGLTLEPTAYEYHVAGKTFYTWCAPDTLLFPNVLGHTAQVISSDPVTGEKVSLIVSPEGIEEVSPSTTVVSWTREADERDIRGTFCHFGRFFARRTSARQWQEDHPRVEILGVQDALDAVRQMDASLRPPTCYA